MWLRQREGRWELKCPTVARRTTKTNEAAELCSRYKEITNVSEIQLRVKEAVRDCEDGETSHSLQDEEAWLKLFNLVCFAEFTTRRRSFVLEEEGVRVDLDQADFGYSVGEIEVLVPEGGDVNSALEKIERTAQRLGRLSKLQKIKNQIHVLCAVNFESHTCIYVCAFFKGLTGNQRIKGKMDVFLERNLPEHYAKLLSEDIL